VGASIVIGGKLAAACSSGLMPLLSPGVSVVAKGADTAAAAGGVAGGVAGGESGVVAGGISCARRCTII
jgi:hypothetical protein